MLVLGHEHGDWCEETLEEHEAILEQYIERRAAEFGLNETVTPLIIEELKRRLSIEETKALSTKKPKGRGSGVKARDVKSRQAGPRFRSSQRQHARTAGKRLQKEVQELQQHLQKQIGLFQDGKLTFKRLETRASIAFKATVETVFKLGMKAVGLVKPAGSSYDLTDNEKKWVKSYIKEELGYFKRFLKQIKNNPSRKDVERRTGLYASALNSVYEAGRVLSAGPNVIITWTLESSNPCPDCILLHQHNPYTPDTLPCLGGDTLIETLSGPYTIRDLAEGKYPHNDLWVWSYDITKNRITPGYVYDVCCVGESPTVQVFLDNGECVLCTKDHPWLLKNGSYLNAEDLREGDSLEPFYHLINEDGYHEVMSAVTVYKNHKVLAVMQGPAIPVYDLSVAEYQNFALSAGVFTHNTTPKAGSTRCFVHNKTRVLTDNGWVPIRNVRVGDYVLTKERKFRKVLSLYHDPPKYTTEDFLKLVIVVPGSSPSSKRVSKRTLWVTKDHKFYQSGQEVYAKDLVPGDYLDAVGGTCKYCGGVIDFGDMRRVNNDYCSVACGDKDLGWCKVQEAHEKNRELALEGNSALQSVSNRLASHLNNHDGKYQTYTAFVEDIEVDSSNSRRRLYCLEVEEDSSFVVTGGIVSHNCLSVCYCTLRIDTATPYQVRKVREKHRNPSWLLKKIKQNQKKKV